MGRNRLQNRRVLIVKRNTTNITQTTTGGNNSSSSDILSLVAGETLNGQRAVRVAQDGKAYLSNPDVTCRQTIGVTTGASSVGTSSTVQTSGILVEPTWNWADNEIVWLSASGALTQTVPTSGYLFQVGVPVGPTKLRIEPQLIARI